MIRKFDVSRTFLKFSVTISSGKIIVERSVDCDGDERICNSFAKSEEMLVLGYLKLNNITENMDTAIKNYYVEKSWSITEVTEHPVQEL